VHLARLLLQQGFSRVSVLDGGFPALVAQLYLSKGRVEPLIISHDHDKWANFLVVSGRNHVKTDLQVAREHVGQTDGQRGNRGAPTERDGEGSIRRTRDMSELEVAAVALDVAIRLGHSHMRQILEQRVAALSQQQKEEDELSARKSKQSPSESSLR
jgi:hypothetical protein